MKSSITLKQLILEEQVEDMTQEERERLYGVIAERLAAIGDSYDIDKKDQASKMEGIGARSRITVTAGGNPDGKRKMRFYFVVRDYLEDWIYFFLKADNFVDFPCTPIPF